MNTNFRSRIYSSYHANEHIRLIYSLSSVYHFLPISSCDQKDNKPLTTADNGTLFDERSTWRNEHAIHAMLEKPNGIECYEIYRKLSKEGEDDEILCIIKFGSRLNGYPGIVHGGITGLMFDNSYGWLLLTSPKRQQGDQAFTANLSINYRRPVMPNTIAILRAKTVSVEERKIHMSATLHDAENQLLADSTTLFIKMRKST